MARIVCQVLHRADRISFLWSEGAASFEPYHLEGRERTALLQLANQLHAKLAQGSRPEVAQLGHQLYRAVFRQHAADAGSARAVEAWLRPLVQSNAVERLEFLSDAPSRIPWNLLIEELPAGDAWQRFWGARFPLGASRRVNALRANPAFLDPTLRCLADLALTEQLPDAARQAMTELRNEGQLLHDIASVSDELKKRVPDVLLLLTRFAGGRLHVGADSFSMSDLKAWMDEAKEGSPDPLVILMGVGVQADQASWQTLLGAASASFSGLIANETLLTAAEVFPLGHRLAKQFQAGQQNLGDILLALRQQGGPALTLSAFCPLQVRAISDGATDAPQAEGVPETYPLPLRPYRPFAAFDAADRTLFFGREEDTIRAALVTDRADAASLLLHGSPAVGKTSFLQAGLIPYLEQEAVGFAVLRDRSPIDTATSERDYPVLLLRATSDLAGQFADALTAFCAQPLTYTTPTGTQVTVNLPALLQQTVTGQPMPAASTGIQTSAATPGEEADDGESAPSTIEARELWIALRDDKEFLGKVLDAVTRSLPFELVLIVDQGEELLTLVHTMQEQARRRKAIEMLAHLAHVAPRCKVVYTIRSQALGQFLSLWPEGCPGAYRTFELRPLTEAEMVDALLWPTSREAAPYSDEVPHQKYGFDFEAGLAQQIVSQAIDVSIAEQQSPLPILQAVGALLYDRQVLEKKQDMLHAADLKDIGGIKEAIAKYLDLTLERLPVTKSTRAALKGLIGKLYTKHADGTLSRDLMPAENLPSYWQAAAEPVEMTVNTAAEQQGLFEIQQLLIAGKNGLYVSLAQDSLARLGQKIDAEREKNAYVRTKVIDVLWIMIPLLFLGAALSFWVTRNYFGNATELRAWEEKAGKYITDLKKEHKADLKAAQDLPRRPLYLGQLALAEQALRSENALRARQLLLSQPAMVSFAENRKEDGKDDGPKDIRGFEWKYLWRHLNSERHLFQGHLGAVNSIAISPDGQWAASGSVDGTIRIWNLARGESLALITGPKSAINAVAFAPDGTTLASAGADKIIRLWDVSKLKTDFVTITKETKTLKGHRDAVLALCYAKNANMLASGGADKAIFLWDPSTGAGKNLTEKDDTGAITGLTFANNDKMLVSAGADGKLVSWDFNAGKKLDVQTTAYQSIAALSVSSDGKTIATGGVETKLDAELGMIRFWNVTDLKETSAAIQHGNGVLSLAFSPDSKSIASGGKDFIIRLWDVQTQNQQHRWIGHLGGIRALAFAKKTLASGDYEGIVKIWNPEQSSGPDVLQAHADWVQCLALNKKNTLLASGARDGSVKLWDPKDGRPLLTLPAHTGAVTAVAFSNPKDKDKLLLAVSTRDAKNQGEVKIWQIDHDEKKEDFQPKLLHTLRERKEGVTCLAFHPSDDRANILLAGSTEGAVRLWNAALGKELETYRGHKDEVRCLCFLYDGKAFVSGGKDGLLCYSEIDRKDVWPSRDLHLGSIESVAPVPLPTRDGDIGSGLLTGGADHTVKFWPVEKDDPKQKVDSKESLRHIRGHVQGITSLAFQGVGEGLIVSASWDGTIKLFDFAVERFTLTGHQGPVRAVVIAADQSFIASAGNDGTIRIWRAHQERAFEKK